MNCPNCQQEITPVDGGFTPHFNRENMRADETPEQLASRFTCTKDARVIDPLSGAIDPNAPVPVQIQNVSLGTGLVSDTIAAATLSPN